MATIYTAKNVVGNDKTTPLFSLKGLANLVPSTITNLHIQGISLERQVAYTQYSSNISTFIHATASGKTTTVSPAPLGLLNHRSSIPLNPPAASFTLQKVLSSDQSDRFINLLGPGASKTQSGKTTIYHSPIIPSENLNTIQKLATPFFNAGRDAVNLKGIIAYKWLSGVISVFLKVHAYSAFRDEDKESIILMEQLLNSEMGAGYTAKETKRTTDKGAEEIIQADLTDKSYTVNEFNKRERSEDDMEDEGESPLGRMTKSAIGFFRFKGNETVVRAHPTFNKISNIGSSSEVPLSPGHVFPYFHGLIQPDGTMMNSIALRRFYQLMGSTHDQCQAAYLELRHGINSLATTNRGMEMCHMLLGIDIALDTQTRCFLIIEKGQYLGFSLLGSRYAIFCNSKWFAPVNETDLSLAIRRMDPHESAVEDMISKLEDLRAKDQFDGTADKVIFADPNSLVMHLDRIKLNEISDEDTRELDRCIRNLNYMGAGYLTKNPQMISEMLETISSNKAVTLERPTYLPSIRAPLKSRLFALLSRFGPEAPSFWNDRGKEIICKPVDKSVVTTGGKRKIGNSDDFGNMPVRILVTPKPLVIAIKDMERVIEKGRVKMDVDERAGRYRNIQVEHEETRKRMWKGLIGVCSDSGKKAKVDSGKEAEGEVDLDELLHNLIGS